MTDLKNKLHELIDRTDDNVLLENVYRALRQQVERKKDFDELTPEELNSLHEANAQYERGETVSHKEVLKLLKQWKKK